MTCADPPDGLGIVLPRVGNGCSRPGGFYRRSAPTHPAKFEERMVWRHRALPSLEEQPCRQETERHAVPTVAQGEPVTRIPAMWTDVRKRVRRRREQSLPRELRIDSRQGWE